MTNASKKTKRKYIDLICILQISNFCDLDVYLKNLLNDINRFCNFFRTIFVISSYKNQPSTFPENVKFVDSDFTSFVKNNEKLKDVSENFVVFVGNVRLKRKIKQTLLIKGDYVCDCARFQPIKLNENNNCIDDELNILRSINSNYWNSFTRKERIKKFTSFSYSPCLNISNFFILLFDSFAGFETQKKFYVFNKNDFLKIINENSSELNKLNTASSFLDYVRSVALMTKNITKKNIKEAKYFFYE